MSPPFHPCACHRDENSAASAARETFFQPKDLVWLDSCDKHRNEGPGMCDCYSFHLRICGE
ncbi:hypothetical protein CEJ86_09485 [Sinorhizobium meliloti]|uniref:Uncharacterized protein n=1 Tax=Rhizobium meliloti TaxID=382 RepID=A0A2J0Z5X3_RHIML|nr:hypothetical protein CEJ86_09485 [Sinorhizobium meliloti]